MGLYRVRGEGGSFHRPHGTAQQNTSYHSSTYRSAHILQFSPPKFLGAPQSCYMFRVCNQGMAMDFETPFHVYRQVSVHGTRYDNIYQFFFGLVLFRYVRRLSLDKHTLEFSCGMFNHHSTQGLRRNEGLRKGRVVSSFLPFPHLINDGEASDAADKQEIEIK